MSERPILFSGPMIRAILDGRKTMTRRVIKPQPEPIRDGDNLIGWRLPGKVSVPDIDIDLSSSQLVRDHVLPYCPYGKPGDRLWVRETWGFSAKLPASTRDEMSWLAYPELRAYRADNPEGNWCWRPSMYMPRWASRLTLGITSVRVERVQEIGEADAIAEGLYPWASKEGIVHYGINHPDVWEQDPRLTYKRLWDSINGKKAGCAWESNPWVFAITFRRID